MVGGDDVRAVLRAERERRLSQVAALRHALARVVAASDGSNADDEHDPEGATVAFERAQLVAQIGHAEASVAAAEQALVRATTGGYDSCRSCGRPIGAARLEALPTATTCIACAAAG